MTDKLKSGFSKETPVLSQNLLNDLKKNVAFLFKNWIFRTVSFYLTTMAKNTGLFQLSMDYLQKQDKTNFFKKTPS